MLFSSEYFRDCPVRAGHKGAREYSFLKFIHALKKIFTDYLLHRWTLVRIRFLALTSISLKRRGREIMHEPTAILCKG